MQLVTAREDSRFSLGFIHADGFYELSEAYDRLHSGIPCPADMNEMIDAWVDQFPLLNECAEAASAGSLEPIRQADEVHLAAPIPVPRRNPFLSGGNYADHVQGVGDRTDLDLKKQHAVFFTKPTTTVTGPKDPIIFDSSVTNQVDYELELAVVIAKAGRDIQPDNAMDFVFGYMVCNDISARDLQIRKPHIDFLRGKGLDTFFPCGPGIVPKEYLSDYKSCRMTLSVNGELRQSSTPGHMVRDIPELLYELSQSLTLIPGDIIATGTPAGTVVEMEHPTYLADGDVVRGEIEHLGVIENRVEAYR